MNEAVMSGVTELEPPTFLNRAERMQLTWALSWPVLLSVLVCSLLRNQPWFWHAKFQNIDLLVSFPQFFLLTTWVVRRTVRMDFPGFALSVIRRGAQVTREMNYRESLSVAWLITWRSTAIFLLLYFPVRVVAGAIVGSGAFSRHMLSVYGWLWCSLGQLVIFYFWIVKAMVAKRYSDNVEAAYFSLRLDRLGLQSQTYE